MSTPVPDRQADFAFCLPHWNKLRDAIAAEGLADQVAPDAAGVRRLAEAGKLDPLMEAHNRIVFVALNLIGRKRLTGGVCPVCLLEKFDWTAEAANLIAAEQRQGKKPS